MWTMISLIYVIAPHIIFRNANSPIYLPASG